MNVPCILGKNVFYSWSMQYYINQKTELLDSFVQVFCSLTDFLYICPISYWERSAEISKYNNEFLSSFNCVHFNLCMLKLLLSAYTLWLSVFLTKWSSYHYKTYPLVSDDLFVLESVVWYQDSHSSFHRNKCLHKIISVCINFHNIGIYMVYLSFFLIRLISLGLLFNENHLSSI